MLREISRLRELSVADLRAEWLRLYGEPSRSRNRDYLWRRLAWRVQELADGGLSDSARARVVELARTGFCRARTPAEIDGPLQDGPGTEVTTPLPPWRGQRLPPPGTVIVRNYKGKELRLVVLTDGCELDGIRYGSLSEAARAITGSKWNGRLFWGLSKRKRG